MKTKTVKKTKTDPVPAPVEKITAYKGFDQDLKCRGMQYEIGKQFDHVGDVSICNRGLHSCEMPLDVWKYYSPATSRFAEVEAFGEIDRKDDEDTKIASAHLTLKVELKLPEIIRKAVEWVLLRAKANTATGYSGHAAATGYYGHAAATGDSGHAAATGNSGHAAATGYYGHAAATGKNSIAASLGFNATAMAGESGWIVLSCWGEYNGTEFPLLMVKTAKVGDGIKANTKYRLDKSGEFIEVNT